MDEIAPRRAEKINICDSEASADIVEVTAMKYEVLENREESGSWRVQSIDHEGMPLVARFSGPRAHQAATEYVAWKYDEDLMTLRTVLFSLQTP